jgi:soluble lytic murein transglycosylase-like protein
MASRTKVAALSLGLLLIAWAASPGPAAGFVPRSPFAQFPSEDDLFLAIYERVAGHTTGYGADEELRIAEAVHRAAIEEGLDPFLILAVIHVESSFIKGARSRAGALGLMQVMPATAEAFADSAGVVWSGPATLFHIESNIRIGAHYLAFKLDRFDGDLMLALAAYCHGPTRVRRILRDDGRLDAERLRYSEKVLRAYRFYRSAVGMPIG